jgi:hypothetical protein
MKRNIIQSLVAIVVLVGVSLLTGCIYGDGGRGCFHCSGDRPHWDRR